jgi:signal-transduction protein with cAMP-binding, CBS, and nucleotidyltransferase domain
MRVMKLPVIMDKLLTDQIEALTNVCEPRVYQTETEIIYEGQKPTAGYLILDGEIQFLKKKKLVQSIKDGFLFGVHELINDMPFKYTAKIMPGSKVFILDRSTIKELLHMMEKNDFPRIFDAYVA